MRRRRADVGTRRETKKKRYEANANTALKGVAIAARRCGEDRGIALGCRPKFRSNRNELTFVVDPGGHQSLPGAFILARSVAPACS